MKWTEQYGTVNVFKRINRVAQIILVLGLMLGINLLSQRLYIRENLSHEQNLTLSAETLAYVQNLSAPVEVFVTIPATSDHEEVGVLFRYVQSVLEEYVEASPTVAGQKLISVDYIDVYRDRGGAAELSRRFGLDEPNVIIFANENRSRMVTESEFANFAQNQYISFSGEQVFTSALLEVSSQERPRIYFTQGHGEMSLRNTDPRLGLSQLLEKLRERNIEALPLDLTQVEEVPPDAALLVIANPQGDLLERELEALRDYLEERSGRLLTLLGPYSDGGLEALLEDWGILLDNRVILEQGNDYVEATGDFLIRHYAKTPLTSILLELQTPLVAGLMRPVRLDPGAPLDERLNRVPLLASSPQSWAESSWQRTETPAYNQASDLAGPVTLAVMATRESISPLGLEIPGGRIVVIGSGDLFSNRRLQALGNETFLLTLVNWLLERNDMLALPPRPVERYFIPLSGVEKQRVALAMLIPAGIVFLAGMGVLWLRRS